MVTVVFSRDRLVDTISRRCNLCSKGACCLIADKLGIMKVGALCYAHYLKWSADNAISFWMVFQKLAGFDAEPARIEKERKNRNDTDWGDFPGVVPLREVEKYAILDAMSEVGGNQEQAAKLLKVTRRTIHKKLKQYNWTRESIRKKSSGSIPNMEKKMILDTLGRTNWDILDAAKELGIAKVTLYRKLKSYGLQRVRYFVEPGTTPLGNPG